MGVQHRPRPGNRIIFRRPNVADVVLAEVKHLDHDAVVLHDGHLRLTRSASGTCTLTRVRADDDDDDDDGAHTSPRITSEDLHELFQRRHALQEDVVESERRIAELQRSERDEEERRARQLAEHTKSVDVAAHDQRIAAALVTTCEAEAWSNFEVWAEKHEQSRAARILDGVRRLAGWAAEVSSCTTTTTSSSSSSLATTSPSLALLLPHAQLHHLTSAVPWAEMEEDVVWTSLQTLKEEELMYEMPEPANTLRVGLAVLRWLQSTLRGLAAHHRHERLVGRLRGAPLLPHVMADEVLEHREFLEMAMEELRELDGLAEEVVAQHKARRASDDRMMCNDVLAILPAKLLSDADWMQLSSASKSSSSSSSSFMHEMATLLWDHLLQMKLVEMPKSAHVVVGSAQSGSVRIPALALPTHNNNNNNSTDVLASKLQKLHATPRLRTPRAGISTGNPSTTVPDHAELVLLREELATCLSELQRVHDERDRLLLERRVRRHVRHTTTTTEPPSRSTSYSPGRPSGIVEELEEQLSVAHQRIVEMERRGEAAALLLSNNNNNNNSISARRQDVQEQLRRDLREVQARMTSAEERLSSVLSDQRQCAEDVAQQSAALISAQERLVAMERQLHRQRATTEMLRAKLARKHTNNSGGEDGATMDAMSGVQQNTSSPTTSACEVQPLTLPELRREVLRLRPAVELARSDEEALRMDLRCDGDCYDQERQILRAISEKSRVIIKILAERLNEVQQADAARPRFPQVDDAGGT